MNPADVQRYPSSVRLPSHTEPPYKARAWGDAQFGLVVGSVGVGVNVAFTQFSGASSGNFQTPTGNAPQDVGVGERAEITWVRCSALDLGLTESTQPNIIFATIRKGKNGRPGTVGGVQGWTRFAMDTLTTLLPAPSLASQLTIVGDTQHMVAPIHLEQGENATLSIQFAGAGAATTWAIRVGWGGWIYPVELEGEAGTIRGTAQDPGVRNPLGNPFRSR